MLVSLFFDLQASLVTYLTETFKFNAYLKKTLPKKTLTTMVFARFGGRFGQVEFQKFEHVLKIVVLLMAEILRLGCIKLSK